MSGACEGCGAPFERSRCDCSWCGRWYGTEAVTPNLLEVTTLSDPEPVYVAAGVLSPNEARALMGYQPIAGDGDPLPPPRRP